MGQILQIDHVAITVGDIEKACQFYSGIFGAGIHAEHSVSGRVLVRQLSLGGAVLSIHQAGNGLDLVAKYPTVGSADICFRWGGSIDEAVALVKSKGIAIVEGPTPRNTSEGQP